MTPNLLLQADGKGVRAIGDEAVRLATARGLELHNPFEHPRSVLADFDKAETILRLVVGELFRTRLLRPSPVLVIHALEKTEGGLTAIERRAFEELGASVGARRTVVWEGDELSDRDLLAGQFDRVDLNR